MKSFTTAAIAAVLAFTTNAAPVDTRATEDAITVQVRYDTTYDNAALPITSIACSDGANGLGSKGYSTLGAVPGFPSVGASPTIGGWNSPNCGACYAITYNGATIYVTAVDAATDSFVLSQQALDKLTGNQAVALGVVTASYSPADASNCGF